MHFSHKKKLNLLIWSNVTTVYHIPALSFSSLGPISVSASADEVGAALNNLWSIKPDTVQVTKQGDSQVSLYTVTFNSDRGMRRQKHWVLLSLWRVWLLHFIHVQTDFKT